MVLWLWDPLSDSVPWKSLIGVKLQFDLVLFGWPFLLFYFAIKLTLVCHTDFKRGALFLLTNFLLIIAVVKVSQKTVPDLTISVNQSFCQRCRDSFRVTVTYTTVWNLINAIIRVSHYWSHQLYIWPALFTWRIYHLWCSSESIWSQYLLMITKIAACFNKRWCYNCQR